MAKIKSKFKSFKKIKDAKKTMVFLPYKASMWDSLESIWRAAYEDKEYCDTYVIPIPYADLKPNGTVAKWHCEINMFPKDVPVLDHRKVNLKKLKPDVIFIHNPYDNYNRVTSVDSNFYSANLKLLSKLLIYVPYYATSGLMSEGQRYMPSYNNVDYIIMQSEAMRPFFDPSVPADKLQPLGSPKFDRVIQMCQNPPEVPEKWKDKINGRKVYFYNTSLGGLLKNTEKFLQKMRYVFETFNESEKACLLWRPHPLTNATLSSMRQEAQIAYEELKNYFIEHNIGIYDDTPDIDESIALSDVYIGDTKTSVTSLFGVAGKPTFFLNNNINALPQKDDWRGSIIKKFHTKGKDWMIPSGNKLYYAPNHDYHYEYYCALSEYPGGNYYKNVIEIDDTVYVCPFYAQDILVIKDHKIERSIPLQEVQNNQKLNLFSEAIHVDNYIFILPNKYPYIVCYDIKKDKVNYISGFNDFFIQPDNDDWLRSSYGILNDQLILASPNSYSILTINLKTFELQQMTIPSKVNSKGGFLSMAQDGDSFWLLPYEGTAIIELNMKEGSVREYNNLPKDFSCHKMPEGFICNSRPFAGAVCDENEVFLAPYWGNMFVRLNKKTGQMQEWKTPFKIVTKTENGYFSFIRLSAFNYSPDKKEIFFMYCPEKQWYNFDLKTKTFDKIDIDFNLEDLRENAVGFTVRSKWIPYGCFEGPLHTLKDLINDTLPGKKFNKEAQLHSYERFNASMDGKAGEKIYQFVKQKLNEKGKS